jgi:predicted nucleotidyltransferase
MRPAFPALHMLGQLGRQIERRRGPDPYPRPCGHPPSLDELRKKRQAIERLAANRSARVLRVFGSVARGEASSTSDVDLMVEMQSDGRLIAQAGLQGDLEDLLDCPVHVITTSGLRRARQPTRELIEREAVPL